MTWVINRSGWRSPRSPRRCQSPRREDSQGETTRGKRPSSAKNKGLGQIKSVVCIFGPLGARHHLPQMEMSAGCLRYRGCPVPLIKPLMWWELTAAEREEAALTKADPTKTQLTLFYGLFHLRFTHFLGSFYRFFSLEVRHRENTPSSL